MMISMIAAIGAHGVIGIKNGMPWDLPADVEYFKEKTLGKTLILGLNTFKSIGEKPLPDRKHIILTKDADYKVPENCFVAMSVDQALKIANSLGGDEVMVCGGASVYAQFLPLAQHLYLTCIHHTFEGDTFFPEFNMAEWKEVSQEDHESDGKNKYSYSFVVLERV